MKAHLNRRKLLRGMMHGASICVGLPVFDCLLNTSGTAFASGASLPVRFGTWFWGCGVNEKRFIPTKLGSDYDLLPELKAIAPYRDSVSVFSGFNAPLDGATNLCHYTGLYSILTGIAPLSKDKIEGATFDTAIADQIGGGSRFRSLEVSACGDARASYSHPSPTVVNPAEASPIALYRRIFGDGFTDPNAADFKPDPRIMIRKSVLSAVKEDHDDLVKVLGAADRVRLDEYMTSVRQIEQQLALQLEPPAPAEACKVPGAVKESPPSALIDSVANNHKIFAQLLAMAMACNQTRVINVVFSPSASTLQKMGTTTTHHQVTHEEAIDEKLGYQPTHGYFVEQAMQGWATMLEAMSSIREGDGTLLDHSLVLAYTDTLMAKVHSLTGVPMMVAGKAGGKIRSGLHIAGNGDPVTRVGLTIQQVMGLSVDKFGTKSMETKKPISEIVV